MKEDTRIDGPWFKCDRLEKIAEETVYKVNITLYPWQQKIVDILDGGQDDRTIWWFWEPYVGASETTFLKWMYQNYKDVSTTGGKAHDMNNCIVRFHEAQTPVRRGRRALPTPNGMVHGYEGHEETRKEHNLHQHGLSKSSEVPDRRW